MSVSKVTKEVLFYAEFGVMGLGHVFFQPAVFNGELGDHAVFDGNLREISM